jgi:hypothetical protein
VITIYPTEERKPVWENIKKIALREGKPASEIAFEAFEEYIKAHGEGNPNYRIDQFPSIIGAYPTPYKKDFGLADLKDLSVEEMDDIIERLDNARSITRTVRQKKRDEELDHV